VALLFTYQLLQGNTPSGYQIWWATKSWYWRLAVNTRIIDGWHRITIFGSLRLPSPTASGLLLNPPSIILLSLGKTEPTNVNTVSVYFTNRRIVSLLLIWLTSHMSCPPPPPHRTTSRCKLICYQWNENAYEGCPFPNFRYEHVCYYCANNLASQDCNHKAIFCPNPPARQPVPQQKPRPPFP